MAEIQRNYTEEQILAHAAKCGGKRNLREIIITDDEGVQVAFLVKKPSRSVVQAITAENDKKNVNGATKIIIGCVLEGDRELLENDGSVFLELTGKISELLSQTKSEVKKL
jgi:hypothetical protein